MVKAVPGLAQAASGDSGGKATVERELLTQQGLEAARRTGVMPLDVMLARIYGAPVDALGNSLPNTSVRKSAEEVADEILRLEQPDLTALHAQLTGVLDPSAFAADGTGPSIASRMSLRRCHFNPADNTRVGPRGAMSGWDQMRARLKGEDGKPMLRVFDNRHNLVRTLPLLQHDISNIEDIADGEDHAADACRSPRAPFPWAPATQIPRVQLAYYPDDVLAVSLAVGLVSAWLALRPSS